MSKQQYRPAFLVIPAMLVVVLIAALALGLLSMAHHFVHALRTVTQYHAWAPTRVMPPLLNNATIISVHTPYSKATYDTTMCRFYRARGTAL